MYVSIRLGEKEHPRCVERVATKKKKRKPREKAMGVAIRSANVKMQARSFTL